jgi:hypothetical protein
MALAREAWLPCRPDFAADELEAICRAPPRPRLEGGDFFRPLRVAITGRLVSPPLFGSMGCLVATERWPDRRR